MQRRSFLKATMTLAVSQMLFGCNGDNQRKLDVQLLKNSIPPQIVNKFSKLQNKVKLNFVPTGQLEDLFKDLQAWQEKAKTTVKKEWGIPLPFGKSHQTTVADLVTLGDYCLQKAIKDKLIQPLEVEQLKRWSNLPQKWQKLVKRNDLGEVDAQGKIWAAPYRWGSTVIVYRQDKLQQLGWTPKDWSDLWRQELHSRISLLDEPREVIGLVLKKLGKSYNTENINKVPDLENQLLLLNQQVKFYDSTRYLEPLINGDTWLAVGWSTDILPVILRYPQLAAVVPSSGTAIWADLWVRPTRASNTSKDILHQWIDFCWTPEVTEQISVFTKTNSPISTNVSSSNIQNPLHQLLSSNYQVLDKSEFLLPLSLSASAEYESLFMKIKA